MIEAAFSRSANGFTRYERSNGRRWTDGDTTAGCCGFGNCIELIPHMGADRDIWQTINSAGRLPN
jgi:hypothetical protein